MQSPLQRIKELIPSLPKEDIPYAMRFYDRKDWESLKELTWSSLQRIQIAQKKEALPEKYVGLDVDSIEELALTCYDYYNIIFPEEEVEDDYNDDSEEEI